MITNSTHNHLGQPIGFPVADWQPRPWPPGTAMHGRTCHLEPLDPGRHAEELYRAYGEDGDGRLWTYLAYGPFASLADFQAHLQKMSGEEDPLFYAIINQASGQAEGVASYLRITPAHGVIEVGHINYAPKLQKTVMATEAMYLMMRRVFDELGYRRYEWKCDALNAASRRAALRLGFQFEGIFRQAVIYKGRNRDTAWFSITDVEWPAIKQAFEAWLDPANFDGQGQQRQPLATRQR
jgi:RimJ/RimL family protein N-acetyltransferase